MIRISSTVGIVLWLCSGVTGTAGELDLTRVRESAEKSLALLQRSGPIFMKQGACSSCHHQSLPAMAVSLARERGLRVDEKMAREQLDATVRFFTLRREQMLQGVAIGGAVDTVGYTLLGIAAEKYPADTTTDAMAYYIKGLQDKDGRWRTAGHRPPTEYSDITTTALGVRALQVYAPEAKRREYAGCVERAAAWLLRATPKATEEKTFRLLGLGWAGASRKSLERAATALAAEQRPDGGWSQLPSLTSDAYATGQALVALHRVSGLPVTDPVYQRGVQFLLGTQLGDGSWHVKTRSIPIMPYFESGFPHGQDQWISAFATSWAAMALTLTVEPPRLTSR